MENQKIEDRKELIEAMKKMNKVGYRCYIMKNENSCYGYFITPKNNIMYVQANYYHMGWEFSIQYIPSKENGSGCMCLEEPEQNITEAVLIKAENEGLAFARRLKVKKYYESPEKWYESYWNKDDLLEIND